MVEVEPTNSIAAPAEPPALVVSNVTEAASMVGPMNCINPLAEVKLPPKEIDPVLPTVYSIAAVVLTVLLWVIVPVPVAVAIKPFRAVVAPTAPVKVILPDPLWTTSSSLPFASMVLGKKIEPLFALVSTVVIVPNIFTGEGVVIVKELEMRLIEEPPVPRLIAPAAVLALVTVKPPRRFVPPALPPSVTAPPVPARKVRVSVPIVVALMVEVVPEKVISAPAAETPALVASNVIEEASVEGPVMLIAPPADVKLPPREIEPALAALYVIVPVVVTVLL